jgi:hypothetical protein
MQKKIFILTLVLTALACSLPYTRSPSSVMLSTTATPDIATLVAQELTAAAPPRTDTATPTAPEPVRVNLSVVYARAGNLVLWHDSGSSVNLTASGQDETPVISDDGQWIVFRRNAELYSIRSDGSDERQLISQAYLDSFRTPDLSSVRLAAFDFVPASHDIFFSLVGETEAYPVSFDDLQRVNVDSGAISIILPAGTAGGAWTFSPDGQWLALAQSNQVRVLRPDGSDDRILFSFKLVSTYSEWFYFPQVVWRNDSAGFYTVIPASAILDNPSEPSRFYYIPLKGEVARLAEFRASPVWQSFPYIAPNGISVAYVQADVLRVIDASTADRVYTSAPGLSILGWTPDSNQVVYRAEDPAAVSALAFGESALLLSDAARFSALGWVAQDRFLFLSAEELHLRQLPQASLLLENGVTSYDFVLLR